MKAISVRQPWALCIASGHKTVENRSRAVSYCGPVAIHASKKPDYDGDRDPRVTGLWGNDPRLGAPMGAVIAVADLIDCHRAEGAAYGHDTCCQPWGEKWYASPTAVGRAHHLVLANIRRLDRPVYCRGKVMVPFDLPDDVAALVEEQLADVCDLCHQELATATRDDRRLCTGCADGWDYYASLTPAERRAEDEAIARYVDETAGQC